MFPVQAPAVSHSGSYTPQIFSKKMLVKFYMATVFGAIANTDYEGEITAHGDTVKIRTVPHIDIHDFTVGGGLQVQNPTPGVVDLHIDKGKYYNVALGDVQRAQSDIAYADKWAEDAGEQLKIAVDGDVLAGMVGLADAANKGAAAGKVSASINLGATAAPVAITKNNVIDFLLDMSLVLDEANVPITDRWAVLPAWMCNRIKKSELKDASLTGDGKSILRNGRIGMIDNIEIFQSNQLPSVVDTVQCTYPFVGHKSALTFASQLLKNETIPNQNDFGELMRGLQVYGYEVVKPDGIVEGYVTAG